MRGIWQLCVLSLVVGTVSGQDVAKEKPFLVLDAGGHFDSITKILYTPDGKNLVTVSKDKTIRIWDLAKGTSIRTLRPPIGIGRAGTLYTADLSRDGLLAVGGIGPQPGDTPIYLIRLESGQIERTLDGHNGDISSLAFSPDGRLLVSASRKSSVRVWEVASGNVLRILADPPTIEARVVFSPDGQRIATGASDGTLRVWSLESGRCEVTMQDPFNDRYYGVYRVAWSSDGKTIAAGSHDWRVRLWTPDGKLIRNLGNLNDLAWGLAFSPDSQKLLVTRGADFQKDCSIFDVQTGQQLVDFKQHQAFAWDGTFSPDGKHVATGGFLGDELFIWNAQDGTVVQRLGGQGQAVWSAGLSPDSQTIAWGNTGKRDLRNQFHPLQRSFHLANLEMGDTPRMGFTQARESDGVWTLERGQFNRSLIVKRLGERVSDLIVPEGQIHSFTWMEKEKVVVGTNFAVFLFDPNTGKMLRHYRGNSGNPIAVTASSDGRYILAGFADQAMRIWSVDREDPLLSLFFAGSEWIAWTPEGYYASSPGGERLMGWHVNNGFSKMANFYPAAQLRKTLYRPDVIKLLLKAGSIEKALETADAVRGKSSERADATDVLPPKVAITSPEKSLAVRETNIEVRARAVSVGTHPVKAMQLLVDGRPQVNALFRVEAPKLGEVTTSWTVRLKPGGQRVSVRAESAVSSALSEEIEITHVAPDPAEQLRLPSLYVLAIGISDYAGDLKLNYAAKDAQALAETLQQFSKPLFEKIEVKQLLDKKATRTEILKEITLLKKMTTQRDCAIVFFAGHGDMSSDGGLYLLPADVDPDNLEATGIASEQVRNLLTAFAGKVIFMLDACHSGGIDSGGKKRNTKPLTDDLIRDLVTDERGVIALCASTGRQFALESNEHRHGLFTLAIIEGLKGKATKTADGAVYLHHLDAYVTDRVKELSQGRQSPTTARPASIRSFPLSKP